MDQDNENKQKFGLEESEYRALYEKSGAAEDTQHTRDWFAQTRHTIYYILGVIEVLLAFRLLFKILGASTASSFVDFLYWITGGLVAPFAGIFGTFAARGAATQFIFEPATIVAMIVYALLARGIIGLVKLKAVDRVYR